MIWLSLIAAAVLIAVIVTIFIVQSNRKKQKNFERLKEELKESAKEKKVSQETVTAATASETKRKRQAEPAGADEEVLETVSPPKPIVVEEAVSEAVEVKPEREIKHYEKFNNSRAIEQLGLSPEEADMFVKELVEQIGEELPKLEAAIEKQEFKQIDEISHMIKGSSTSLGSGGVADLLSEMNEYCKKGRDLEIINGYLYNLKYYFNELKTQFS